MSRGLVAALQRRTGHIPPWFDLRASVEDWWKGYRQIFPTAHDMAFAIVALQRPTTRAWQYVQLKGLPFGLGAAVNQFSRPPMMLTQQPSDFYAF